MHGELETGSLVVVLVAVLSLGGGACGDAQSPGEVGVLTVTVMTAGTRLDGDGYAILVDGRQLRTVAVRDSVSIPDVPAGNRRITLSGVAANCDDENATSLERQVQVVAGRTASVAFRLVCGHLVLVDEAHSNFHTISDRYRTFAAFLRANGWVVKPSRFQLHRDSLSATDVFVIANAIAAENVDRWVLPTPSAFSVAEIAAVREWVQGGGALLLLADHMPFAGAAADLGAAFGMRFGNGFAFTRTQLELPRDCLDAWEIQVFRRSDGTLADHAITRGRSVAERVDSVATFTGQAFQIEGEAEPLLTFGRDAIQLYPTEAWVFLPTTPRAPVEGWRQGAVLRPGRGRVAVFGDATMYFDKVCGPENRPNGMNHPVASQNRRFLLNILAWLVNDL